MSIMHEKPSHSEVADIIRPLLGKTARQQEAHTVQGHHRIIPRSRGKQLDSFLALVVVQFGLFSIEKQSIR